MITTTQFNNALNEINESYAKLVARIEALEEQQKPKKSSPNNKKEQKVEENA